MTTLVGLDDDTIALVVDALPATALGQLCTLTHKWRGIIIPAAAERRVRRCRPAILAVMLPRIDSAAMDARNGGWLRALAAIELLITTVGDRPEHTWHADWLASNTPLAPGSIERLKCKFAWALELREDAWPREHAAAVTLLCACHAH